MKNFISMLFIMATLFISLPVYSVSVWDGTAEKWTAGAGSKSDPYQIQTAQNLAYLAQSVNDGTSYAGEYFVQTDDIDLDNIEWAPIGSDTYKFAGVFDGADHVIKNIKITTSRTCNGLFGYTTDTIKNLSVSGSIRNGVYVGGITGYLQKGRIENCKSDCTVSSSSTSSQSFAGGISGAGGDSITITNCSNTGSVSSSTASSYAYAGGILGSCGSSSTITNCSNTGSVSSSTTSSQSFAGGILGIGGSSSTITNCSNTGSVSSSSSTSSTSSASAFAGGILGTGGSSSTITNCSNTGSVSSYSTTTYHAPDYLTHSTSYAGGILGQCDSSITITNCSNTGSVSSSSSTSSTSYTYTYAGGISGFCVGSITNCYNRGEINSSGGIKQSYSYGIAKSAKVVSSYNVGSLKTGYYKYGIGNGTVTNSYYLETCGSESGNGTKETASAMRSVLFPDMLNGSGETVFVMDVNSTNDGYPIFGWQNQFTIRFLNDDGAVLQTENLDYGETPVYKGAEPSKAATKQYSYTFAGWNNTIVPVDGAKDYTATYTSTVNKYEIKFVNYGGTELQKSEEEYGTTPSYTGATPIKPADAEFSYTFSGWSPEVVAVVGEQTYTAQYSSTVNKYVIRFLNEDGTELQSEELAYGATPAYKGETPTKDATAQYTYTFAGWDSEIETITGAKDYTATYTPTTNKYVVRFLNDDGTVLQSEELAYGATPAYTGETPTKEATAQYTYTFNGWDSEIAEVTGAKDYTATYTPTTNKYTVRFLNEDGTELQSEELEYGVTPAYTGETPTKEATAQYTYTFAGWNNDIVAVTGAKDYTATYTSTTNKYTVRFLNDDGTELQSEELEYGATPEYKGETPTKDATAQYTYTFNGWDAEIAEVTGAKDYTATYTPTTNKYTVRFLNEGGTELQSEELEYGVTPAYTGETPTKEATAQYTYTFNGWDSEIAEVTGAKDYTATYTPTTNKYVVRFLNDDGTVLQSEELAYGATPAYTGETPTKEATAQYTYTFNGWDAEIAEVTGAKDYTATYTPTTNKYVVRFLNEDGTELQNSELEYGATPAYTGETPTKDATAQYTYIFNGWDSEITEVTGAKDYTAIYTPTTNKYVVRFLNEDGTELQSEELDYGATPAYTGETPTKDATAQYTYTFNGWDSDIEAVTGAKDYTATYTPTTNKYTVRFLNDDGTELQSEEIEYGVTPAYTGETPTKDATAQYTYTFAGWDSEIAEVTGAKDYTATYTPTTNKYVVRFLNEDGTELQSEELEYGTTPEYTGETPTKEATAQYTYTFNGWDSEIAEVTGAKDYTATYTPSTNKYVVRFLNEDGTALQSEELAYGATPAYRGVTPTKAKTQQYTYTFSGWSPAIAEVTGAQDYTAQFSSTVNKYKVTTKAETEGVTTGDGIYEYGTEVTLTATPNDKYEFVRWSNGSTSAEINITVTEDVLLIAYFQFKPCTVEKYIEVSVPEGGTLTLKSGKVITVTKSQKIDDLKITPLECDSLFHYYITMIRQNADNTPECDGAPSVAKFDWLLMLNVKALNSLGYKFSESSVSWYRVVGDIDNLDDPESKRNDIIVGTGYGYTIDKSLAGTGDYYALIDLPVQTADVGCKGIMRTSVHHYSKRVTVKPSVVPTMAAPNQRMQVIDLPLDENVEILVYDYVGRLCQTFTSQGDAIAWFDAEKAAGNYMVVIKTAEGVETVKYIVKGK